MRLIDADRLIEDMGASCLPIMEKGISEITGDESCIVDHINAAPTIDAVPVVHAKWTEDGFCSSCGNEAGYTEWIEKTFDYDWDENLIESGEAVHRNHKHTEYCPRCGAKMDGEEDE